MIKLVLIIFNDQLHTQINYSKLFLSQTRDFGCRRGQSLTDYMDEVQDVQVSREAMDGRSDRNRKIVSETGNRVYTQ